MREYSGRSVFPALFRKARQGDRGILQATAERARKITAGLSARFSIIGDRGASRVAVEFILHPDLELFVLEFGSENPALAQQGGEVAF
jgi:hypothetical protein